MFNYLKYRLELYQLQKSSRRLLKQYKQINKQVVNKGSEHFMELNDLARQQDELQTWIEFLQTKYYQEICNRYVIPMPDKDEGNYCIFNFDDGEGEREILNTEGFYKVRSLIRQEKKERREALGFWVTLLIGLLGAIIGLAAILKT